MPHYVKTFPARWAFIPFNPGRRGSVPGYARSESQHLVLRQQRTQTVSAHRVPDADSGYAVATTAKPHIPGPAS